MKILITLDYELFLGTNTGSVMNSLIIPMNKLVEIGDKYGLKYTLFVDATYLAALKNKSSLYPCLMEDYLEIKNQLIRLDNEGHSIQLHVHPQWYFSEFDGKKWMLDTKHYKLSDLTDEESDIIFGTAKETLEDIIGHPVYAFRAGGFSAQPTELLTSLMSKYNILIDSSVFSYSDYNSPSQKYDYKVIPNRTQYRFKEDICKENISGDFIEIPITTYKLSPIFYWRLVMVRLLKNNKHKILGDGNAVKTTGESIKERLTKKSYALATIDGFKIFYLQKIINKKIKENKDLVCIIGHPKLASPYSLSKLDKVLSNLTNVNYVSISEMYNTIDI